MTLLATAAALVVGALLFFSPNNRGPHGNQRPNPYIAGEGEFPSGASGSFYEDWLAGSEGDVDVDAPLIIDDRVADDITALRHQGRLLMSKGWLRRPIDSEEGFGWIWCESSTATSDLMAVGRE